VVALIELDEGVRVVGNIVDVDPDEVKIGTRVEVTFAAADGQQIPVFTPVRGQEPGHGTATRAMAAVEKQSAPGCMSR
jgi:hypothetical protein